MSIMKTFLAALLAIPFLACEPPRSFESRAADLFARAEVVKAEMDENISNGNASVAKLDSFIANFKDKDGCLLMDEECSHAAYLRKKQALAK